MNGLNPKSETRRKDALNSEWRQNGEDDKVPSTHRDTRHTGVRLGYLNCDMLHQTAVFRREARQTAVKIRVLCGQTASQFLPVHGAAVCGFVANEWRLVLLRGGVAAPLCPG